MGLAGVQTRWKMGASGLASKEQGRGWLEIPNTCLWTLHAHSYTHSYTCIHLTHSKLWTSQHSLQSGRNDYVCFNMYIHTRIKRAILFMNSPDPIFYLPNTIAFHLKEHSLHYKDNLMSFYPVSFMLPKFPDTTWLSMNFGLTLTVIKCTM